MNKLLLMCFFCLLWLPVLAENTLLPDAANVKRNVSADFLTDGITDAPMPYVHTEYDYTDFRSFPVTLKITETISTKDKNLYEGKKLFFEVVDAPSFIGRGQKVEGYIGLIIHSGMNGIPYTIILDEFNIPGIPKNKLASEYHKNGFNRTWFVLPLKWALTFLPPTGSFANIICGGHAKITPKDRITLWYYPNWK